MALAYNFKVRTIVLDCVHRFAYESPWHSALGRNTLAGGRSSGTDIDHEFINDFGSIVQVSGNGVLGGTFCSADS